MPIILAACSFAAAAVVWAAYCVSQFKKGK